MTGVSGHFTRLLVRLLNEFFILRCKITALVLPLRYANVTLMLRFAGIRNRRPFFLYYGKLRLRALKKKRLQGTGLQTFQGSMGVLLEVELRL